MGLYGVAPANSIYPGQIGYMFGSPAMPTGPTALQSIQTDSVSASGVSRPVTVASQPMGHPSTQRQIIWRVFGAGSLNINLQASVDDVDANYVTIANYTGTGNSGPLIVQADISPSPGTPEPLATANIVSAARFFRTTNAGVSTVSVTTDISCL